MSKINKRRNSNRIPQHDYSLNGYYFITVCSFNRLNIFGEIINNNKIVGADGCRPENNTIKIQLNEFGAIVEQELKNTENIRHEIKLDEYVIMPNHIHCIIIIQRNITDDEIVTGGQPAAPTDIVNCKQTLSSFVAGFKSIVTKRINILRNTPKCSVWQRSFYDHIVRNDKSLCLIRKYIRDNPLTWKDDEYNSVCNQTM